MATDNQFWLLRQARFRWLFITQFLGAFNDNLFKNTLILFIVFQAGTGGSLSVDTLINLCAGLFILPFFLFSATAGQLADKFEKSALIRATKLLEIAIMVGAAIGFYFQNVPWLIALLFLMGTQSALFGPVKYSILPQHLKEEELVGGNALVESGTFIAILLGTILGGVLIAWHDLGLLAIAALVVVVATAGYLTSRGIPLAPAPSAGLVINWNVVSETWRMFHYARGNRAVFLSILGISWFWFLGAAYLTQLPNFTKLNLGGSEQVATLLLAGFAIGIGAGSLLCERLSGRKIEIGLVPFGSIGLTLFGIDLFFAVPVAASAQGLGALDFLQTAYGWRVVTDVVLIGLFGGFYIVPLYALVQHRSDVGQRSRIIATNNILNALFMVASALAAIGLLAAGLTIPQLLLAMALFNAVVAIYIYSLVPEFLMRFLVWLLIHSLYRVEKSGLERIPDEGPAVLVCNHVSLVDALVIGGCVRRPVRFVMYYKIFRVPILNFVFRTARAIPIAGSKEDPQRMEQAFDEISRALRQGDVICIFPEGKLTEDGEMNPFRPGILRILERDPVPVIPIALRGLWGSYFSRYGGKAMRGLPRGLFAKIGLVVGAPAPPAEVQLDSLQQAVLTLRGDWK
ncbi:MAG: MFS transporter [Sulfuricaulis sp.]|nr:MFS transporter [Sulfuricaulis sp.]